MSLRSDEIVFSRMIIPFCRTMNAKKILVFLIAFYINACYISIVRK